MRFAPDLRLRECELARELASRGPIFALDRSDALPLQPLGLTGKLAMRWKLSRCRFEILETGPVTRFRAPISASTGPPLHRISARRNEARVCQWLERFDCERVFHSSPFFFMPAKKRAVPCHFDLVDNFFDDWPETRVGSARRQFLHDAMARCDTLSACSLQLCDRVQERLKRRPEFVPNGADLDAIAAWPKARVEALRQRLGLGGRHVAVYVGNHLAAFSGMDMLLKAFAAARKHDPKLALVIVGPGEAPPRIEGVTSVGAVAASEVWDYFHLADLGVLPFSPCRLTHDALPLKVLEFGAASKPMLATPLEELKRHDFPHVRFADFDAAVWEEALLSSNTWNAPGAGLQAALQPFSWQSAAVKLEAAMGLSQRGKARA